MAEQEEIEQLATEAVAPIDEELRQRLDSELADRDSLALESALLKAFVNGMRAGAGEVAERVIDSSAASTTFGVGGFGVGGPQPTVGELNPELPWLDPWADRYGRE
ncbi:MAG TPA: hypothetical protein VGH21_09060 [Solirubrobacteraceae bacterium]|jgi:hypothetical protein